MTLRLKLNVSRTVLNLYFYKPAHDIFLTAPPKPTVTLQPSWTQIHSGETVTVRCDIQGGEGAQWTYEWRPDKLNTPPTSSEYRISRATKSDSGGYSCRGKRRSSWTEWSDITKLTVSLQPSHAGTQTFKRSNFL
uniref:Ig-like domain-containing protein n=1 Tax=Haplochromis burtoni TaxID=8153 RepID=A0A3Q3CA65_HAPBU